MQTIRKEFTCHSEIDGSPPVISEILKTPFKNTEPNGNLTRCHFLCALKLPSYCSITAENKGPLFQTECFLIRGAEKKGVMVQMIMEKGVTIQGYYSVIILGHIVG